MVSSLYIFFSKGRELHPQLLLYKNPQHFLPVDPSLSTLAVLHTVNSSSLTTAQLLSQEELIDLTVLTLQVLLH